MKEKDSTQTSAISAALANRRLSTVIGGYAVAFHARPRHTKDLDIFVASSPENLERLERALAEFGAPIDTIRALRESAPTDIVWMGAPPVRVDILRTVSGLEFSAAYGQRVDAIWDGIPVSIVGRSDLIRAKKAAGRPQDLLDVEVREFSSAGP